MYNQEYAVDDPVVKLCPRCAHGADWIGEDRMRVQRWCFFCGYEWRLPQWPSRLRVVALLALLGLCFWLGRHL